MASPSPPDAPVVALVLGAAAWEGGRASPTLERRARHAARLLLEDHVTHIVGCGGIGRFPPSEASLICRICRAAGIAETTLHAEDRSTNTLENIAFALPILQEIGTDRVCIVTDGYHLPRAHLIARRMGLRCQPAPPPPPGPLTARKIKALLREAVAYLWYLLRAPSAPP
ncbi:YdcF family protein [Tropicimonas sp. TH_r6]|uniref:YdcF family protein n=1 Tax=Tropicimonas sp. TH_r6 TaxID=3082085 RepID=UPI002953D7AE|nr:YdcF family protein [Tropicimonas sp. TH_r6]MDV7142316.1 YdcF family protein [Tropicimonas sp. TH_r6]